MENEKFRNRRELMWYIEGIKDTKKDINKYLDTIVENLTQKANFMEDTDFTD